jgi:predicted nucleic acid-binding protein
VNLVDSSAWLEYLADGPNASHYAKPLQDSAKLVVPVICLYEVFKVVLRETGEHEALQVAASMQKGKMVEVSPRLALAAARLSLQEKLPMAESMILAIAHDFKATLWTQDAHFSRIPEVRYFPAQKK